MQKSRSSGSEVVDATGSQKSVVLELASRFGTRVVVLGSGFGGVSFVKSFLSHASSSLLDSVELVWVTKRNYHLFSPLLYQVAGGLVDEHHVLDPLPHFGGNRVRVVEAEVEAVDFTGRAVYTDVGPIGYNYLVVALGSSSNDFGIPGVKENTLPLKTAQDGERIRNRILASFGQAAITGADSPERVALLTFAVVGGGATGVELAGTIRDYTGLLAKRYGFRRQDVRVLIVESAGTLLPGIGGRLPEKCRQDLESAGIDVRLGARVVKVDVEGVHLSNGELIESRNVFWTAGVKPNPVIEGIPETVAPKKKGRLEVDSNLRLIGHSEVYVVGDCAWVNTGGDTTAAPQTAAAAVQEGEYAGSHLAHTLGGKKVSGSFIYHDQGIMLSLGRFSGLVELANGIILSGLIGWLVWRMVHLVSIATARNKLGVMFDWGLSLVRRRIITRTD
jgi:NADH dehydrogenase